MASNKDVERKREFYSFDMQQMIDYLKPGDPRKAQAAKPPIPGVSSSDISALPNRAQRGLSQRQLSVLAKASGLEGRVSDQHLMRNRPAVTIMGRFNQNTSKSPIPIYTTKSPDNPIRQQRDRYLTDRQCEAPVYLHNADLLLLGVVSELLEKLKAAGVSQAKIDAAFKQSVTALRCLAIETAIKSFRDAQKQAPELDDHYAIQALNQDILTCFQSAIRRYATDQRGKVKLTLSDEKTIAKKALEAANDTGRLFRETLRQNVASEYDVYIAELEGILASKATKGLSDIPTVVERLKSLGKSAAANIVSANGKLDSIHLDIGILAQGAWDAAKIKTLAKVYGISKDIKAVGLRGNVLAVKEALLKNPLTGKDYLEAFPALKSQTKSILASVGRLLGNALKANVIGVVFMAGVRISEVINGEKTWEQALGAFFVDVGKAAISAAIVAIAVAVAGTAAVAAVGAFVASAAVIAAGILVGAGLNYLDKQLGLTEKVEATFQAIFETESKVSQGPIQIDSLYA